MLELAGGLLPTAAIRHIEVQRLVAHEKQTMLSLNIPDAGDSTEVTKKLQSFPIQDGDRVRIFPLPPATRTRFIWRATWFGPVDIRTTRTCGLLM